MSAAFTPAPWGVDDEGHVRGYGQGSPYGEDLIAMPLGDTSEQAEANARLIAAAPTMYERLALLVQVLSALPVLQKNDELWGAYTGAVAVLLQVRGEAA